MSSFRAASLALAFTFALGQANPIADVLLPTDTVSATATSVEELTPAFEAFRTFLGGSNNGNAAESISTGHRQINWDAPAVPFDMPGEFFANVVPRGALLETSDGSDSFRVSNPPEDQGIEDDKFDSIVGSLSSQFQQFSNERLFSTFEDNKLIIKFVDPGNTAFPAAVTGLGVVFTGVNTARLTKMEFYDANECLLACEYVTPSPAGGLSFLGVHFNVAAIVTKVCITLGGASLEESGGDESSSDEDVVVMDDFLYGEPQRVVLPTEPSCAAKKSGKKSKSSKRERGLVAENPKRNAKKNLRRSA
ncbi:MAG: hypothetical protein SGILL_004606 [Bacillariaceae sp.]